MTDDEFDSWVSTYIAFHEADEVRSGEKDPRFWAIDAFFRLNDEDPELSWKAILEILRRRPGNKVLGILAAGPLEDLIQYHGPEYIDRIETEAGTNPDFRNLLGGVWKSSSRDIWERVVQARGEGW